VSRLCEPLTIVGTWKVTDASAPQMAFSVAPMRSNGLYPVTWSNGSGSKSGPMGPMPFYITMHSNGVYIGSDDTRPPSTYTMVGAKTVNVRYTNNSNAVVNYNFAKQ
jgi:hypothetical protein